VARDAAPAPPGRVLGARAQARNGRGSEVALCRKCSPGGDGQLRSRDGHGPRAPSDVRRAQSRPGRGPEPRPFRPPLPRRLGSAQAEARTAPYTRIDPEAAGSHRRRAGVRRRPQATPAHPGTPRSQGGAGVVEDHRASSRRSSATPRTTALARGSPTQRGASSVSSRRSSSRRGSSARAEGHATGAPALTSTERSSTAPSADPSKGWHARSGCGMSPTTLRASLQMPAMSSVEPLGLST
jgi:hypothetical protein